ncbi:hypothetical protein O6H91_Y192100 [Diphasiastrum complanatum]|nr:hypothetical protein O6H91_Y192100 [Diphasiastrum complanatum]
MATLEGSEMTPDHHQDVQPAKEGTVFSDPYRSHMYDDLEVDTEWRHGGPPGYEAVNALFEQGRTRVWPKGSLEEIVQNLVKSWEMELSHKMRASDFKTIDPQRFTLSANDIRNTHRIEEVHHCQPKNSSLSRATMYSYSIRY